MPDYYNREKFTSGRPGGPGGPRPGGGTPPPRGNTPPPRGGPPPRGNTPPPRYGAPPPPRYRTPPPFRTPPPGGSGRWPRRKGNIDWGIFILLLIFAWPFAIVYLLYKLLSDQNAARKVSDTINQAESMFRGAKAAGQGTAQQEAQADYVQETAEVRDDGPSGSQQARQAAAAQAAAGQASPPDQNAAKKGGAKQDGSPEKNLPSKVRSTVFRIVGACLFFAGTVALADELDSLFRGYLFLEDLVAAGVFTLGGLFLFGKGQLDAVFRRKALKYLRAIGEEDAMSLDEIAKRVGRSRKKVIRDLQKLIDKGYLGDDAYLDLEVGYFLRYGATVEPPPQAEAPVEEKEESAAPEHPYAAILQNIRHANDRIADEALSAKIDRLEEITRQILREVAEHPEKRESMHTFFDYYLPTTQKLLDTYADFEAAGVEGENLREAKRRIESTMDGIVEGFERQLDGLFKADVMDVESDIRVMESMLRRDSASPAKDFGYDQQSQQQGG